MKLENCGQLLLSKMLRDNSRVWANALSKSRDVPNVSRLTQSLGFAKGQLKRAERLVALKPNDKFCKDALYRARGLVEYLELEIKTRG